MFNLRGFTLLELMVSVSILSILIGIAVPNFNHFIVKQRVDNEISLLNRLLFITRNIAINERQMATLCPLGIDNKCTTQWHKSLSIFIDINKNKVFEPALGEYIIFTKQAIRFGDKLHYGKGRNGIIFSPTGRLAAWGSNGTFRYCPHKHEDKNRGIRVAVSGRIYVSGDQNNDGIDEDRSGKPLKCNE